MKKKITKSQLKQLIKETKEEYQKFFRNACKKFNMKPGDIDKVSDEKKKKLFNYIDKNWNSQSEKDKDGKKNESSKTSISETIEFDFGTTMQLIDQDNFLKYAFKTMKGSDKQKAEAIFNSHILGDSVLEKKYKKAL